MFGNILILENKNRIAQTTIHHMIIRKGYPFDFLGNSLIIILLAKTKTANFKGGLTKVC